MLLITGESRFADLAERTLYNAVLSGVSLDGQVYFYVNPLADDGEPEHLHRGGPSRKPWHDVACCPPNVMRLVASLGHYLATHDDHGLQLHQYGEARIAVALPTAGPVAVRVESAYPWDGRVRIAVEKGGSGLWTLSLRLPAWSEGTRVEVNGEPSDAAPDARGYLRLERSWTAGDVVDLTFSMRPRLIEAHPRIESTRGCLAIERGPLVYCLEQQDQQAPVSDLEIDPAAPLTAAWEPDLLDGVAVVRGSGFAADHGAWEDRLYRPYRPGEAAPKRRVDLTAIPAYAWANRGPNAMQVWIPRG
jgi:DUF1680 family protein